MQQYNDRLRMRDLFMNPRLACVFPQFSMNEKLQGTLTICEIKKRVVEYLASALNGTITGDGMLSVNGKVQTVLNHVRQFQPLVEGLYNNIPKIAQALKSNTVLYLPYATCKQLENIKSLDGKIKAMQAVIDNFQYNSELGALNSVRKEKPEQFALNKKLWERKVGYRRLKKI